MREFEFPVTCDTCGHYNTSNESMMKDCGGNVKGRVTDCLSDKVDHLKDLAWRCISIGQPQV